jgi:hypothetical protein
MLRAFFGGRVIVKHGALTSASSLASFSKLVASPPD